MSGCKAIAQAEAKKIVGWLEDRLKVTIIGEERSVPNKTQIRFLLEEEWQTLRKEVLG